MADIATHPNGISQVRANVAGQAYASAFYGNEPTGNNPHVQRAIVREVIPSIHQITDAHRQRLIESGLNDDTIPHLPRNTAIIQLVQGIAVGVDYIPAFPFFSSHLALPLKPGEYVWVFFEDPSKKDIGFWMSRIHETEFVEDANYTHGDRKFSPDGNPSLSRPKNEGEKVVGFPNGQDDDTMRTLDEPDAFEKINKESLGSDSYVGEPVPRLTKRVADFAIQGSNNTAIILGEDRSGSVDRGENLGKKAGTIDLVVGRGVKYAIGQEPEQPTAPTAVKTSRDYLENDKTAEARAAEGDPDFINDLARSYTSMKTDGDDNFNIVKPSNELGASTEATKQKSYIVHKADETRIIARESGAIHIIKEGENPASIILHANGTVQIDASKIQLGREVGGDKGFVKFSEYKAQMEQLMNMLQSAFNDMGTAMNTNASPGFGNPNPGVTTAGVHATTAGGKFDALKAKIKDVRSETILGE